MLSDEERARRIAQTIEKALTGQGAQSNYTVTKRTACSACPPTSCSVCGFVLPGDVIIIHHKDRGKRHLSDRAVHYLGHGLKRYQTGYIYQGEPVLVDLDLDELEGYLDLR